jgi:hypothetical protein
MPQESCSRDTILLLPAQTSLINIDQNGNYLRSLLAVLMVLNLGPREFGTRLRLHGRRKMRLVSHSRVMVADLSL